MKTVSEVSRISGVSVRTLHHYDAIGLLSPTEKTESGYRLYDDGAITKLQTILIFRELEFSLAEIKEIMHSPNFDIKNAIKGQIEILKLQKNHIENLIILAENISERGDAYMNFEPFDKNKIDEYKAEAKERWCGTEAYAEYEKKTANRKDNSLINNGLLEIFAEFGKIMDLPLDGVEAQIMVEKLQKYITDNYYNCTNVILSSLGEMYVCDKRFKENIDRAGGDGTAEYVGRAIGYFCDK